MNCNETLMNFYNLPFMIGGWLCDLCSKTVIFLCNQNIKKDFFLHKYNITMKNLTKRWGL